MSVKYANVEMYVLKITLNASGMVQTLKIGLM